MKKLILILLILFIPSNVYAKNYKDIQNYWGRDYIIELSNKNVLDGYPNGDFLPNKLVSKAEFIKIINRIFQLDDTQSVGKDISKFENSWFYNDLKKAINGGYLDINTFNDGYITRIETINIIGKCYNLSKNSNSFKYFIDIDNISEENKIYISNLLEDKIINGKSLYCFAPDDYLTRGELAKIILLSINKYGNTIQTENMKIKEISENLAPLKRELINLINESEKLNTKSFTKESVINLNIKILKAKNLVNENLSKEEVKKLIQDILDAKQALRIVNKFKLDVYTKDSKDNSLDVDLYINSKAFDNGSYLEKGSYLLTIKSSGLKIYESYVEIIDEDKTLHVFVDNDEFSKERVKLTLSNYLYSDKYIYNIKDRVTVHINPPQDKEIDCLMVNGLKKRIISDEYNFIIKEDTNIEIVFK